MLAVICVRDGTLPNGAAEAAAECGGRVLLVGSGLDTVDTRQLGAEVRGVELDDLGAGRVTPVLAPLLRDEPVVVLPSSPDGRDLAPRLAHALRRPLLAGAVEVADEHVTVSRGGGLELHTFRIASARGVVATLQPGVRDAEHHADAAPIARVRIDAATIDSARSRHEADVVAVLPPDIATMDLGEARRVLGGGAGLDSAARFEQLTHLAMRLGAVMGATRVVTDRGWVGHERQIGTTGVVVDPQLYVAFGVSGAVQHTSGLGTPEHVISVNTDPHCPMMQMSDLAVVSDANAVLDELLQVLDANAGGAQR